MKKLIKVEKDERCFFIGTFENTVKRYDYTERRSFEYVRIINIINEYGEYVCKYTEFNIMKGFSDLHLQPGDLVSFRARPVICKNAEDVQFGYYNNNTRAYYRLMNPTKIQKLHIPVQSIKPREGYYRIQIKTK